MALILFLDTCTSTGLVAVLNTETEAVAIQVLPDAQRFGEQLHSVMDALLKQQGYHLSDLDAVAVVSGPGSYTGLRVGLATAKGLCFALDRPLLTLNRLMLLEYQFRMQGRISGTAAVLIPARTEEWFAYATDAYGIHLLPPQHLTEADWQRWMAAEKRQLAVAVASDSIKPGTGWVAEPLFFDNSLDPEALGPLIGAAFKAGNFADLVTAKPDYLKNAYVTS